MSESVTQVRDRDGSLTTPTPTTPACTCDGDGWAGIVIIGGRDVLKACAACKPHLAGLVPTVAERHVGRGPRRRRLAVVR